MTEKLGISCYTIVNTVGKRALLGKIMLEILILCRNCMLINRQNIADKTITKSKSTLKCQGSFQAFLVSGLSEGTY